MGRKLSLEARKNITGWLFSIPMIAFFGLFVAYPIADAVRTSFYGFDYTKYYWTGLSNYKEILTDKVFLKSIGNTFAFVLWTVPASTIIALFISVVIHRFGDKMQSFFKTVFYIPGVTSVVSLTLVWQYIYNSHFGAANYIRKLIGLEPVNWLGIGYAYPSLSLIILSIGLGSSIVVLTAGLNGIPKELYESAYIDGAKKANIFFGITLPLLKPTLLYVVVTSTIGAFQIFVVIMLMTGGGPNHYTSTILMLTYREAFMNMNMGKACAMGIILCFLVCTVAIFQFKFLSSDVEY